MFAYPWGGSRGASGGTLILVLIGGVVIWRRGHAMILSLLAMPMALALAAAALKLYPYGGQARIMQYIAPAVCLLAGLGLSVLLELLPWPGGRRAAIRFVVSTLAVGGSVAFLAEFRHPYRAIYDYQAREFARQFWPEQSRRAELACVQWDFKIRDRRAAVVRTAIYLCNQHIYSPNRSRYGGPRWALVSPQWPLRCVVFDAVHIESRAVTAWLESMKKSYDLRRRVDLVVPTTGLDSKPWDDHVFVFEFEPSRQSPAVESAAAGQVERITR